MFWIQSCGENYNLLKLTTDIDNIQNKRTSSEMYQKNVTFTTLSKLDLRTAMTTVVLTAGRPFDGKVKEHIIKNVFLFVTSL